MKLLYFLLIIVVVRTEGHKNFPHLRKLKTQIDASIQTAAAQDVIRRVIPDRAHEFNIMVDPLLAEGDKDAFTLVTDAATGKMNVTGNSGVVATWGFYHFLKFHCGCHVSWEGKQINIPKPLPVIKAPAHKMVSNDAFRYYENVCTVSYSFAWYNWKDWEKHIDWMALNGINLPLAFNGQEAIMQRVFTEMGFSQKDLDSFFSGPAFLAWFRMGNLQAWGGPLPQSWINDQLVLQHRILDRMRSLGMIPVLAAFGGHVPANIKTLYPNANVSTLTNWSRFKPPYTGTTIIDFQDPLFAEIGQRFIQETIKELGTNHIYATDTFNEMRPKSSNTTYLRMSGAAIYKGMVSADPEAVWLMQGWLFQDSSFWKQPQAKALLTSVPLGRMIVLDLFAEISPLWQRYDSFFGQPFVWCMLHNYGGTMDLYGDIQSVNVGPSIARKSLNSSMIGVGISPEGIDQNYVMYEFMLDQAMGSGSRNLSEWISGYAKRRYGVENQFVDMGWQLLRSSVYNSTDTRKHHGRLGFVKRPRLKMHQFGTVYSCNKTMHDAGKNVIFTRRPYLTMKEAGSVYSCNKTFHDGGRSVIFTRRPYLNRKESSTVYNCTTGIWNAGWDVVFTKRPQIRLRREISTVYNCTRGISNGGWDVVYTERPQLRYRAEIIWYDPKILFYAWDYFIAASKSMNSTLFRYDLVDVTRNCLEILSYKYYVNVIDAYAMKDAMLLEKASKELLLLLKDLDTLLASDSHFLLGNWLEAAKSLGYTHQEKKLYEFNARNQITLWGPNGEIADYASKQWAGLVGSYYLPRWKLFTDMLQSSLRSGSRFSQIKFNRRVFEEVEQPFNFDRTLFPTEPKGDSIKLALQIFMKYRPVTYSLSSVDWETKNKKVENPLKTRQRFMNDIL